MLDESTNKGVFTWHGVGRILLSYWKLWKNQGNINQLLRRIPDHRFQNELQQDNNLTRPEELHSKGFDVMQWPNQSPDLNPC